MSLTSSIAMGTFNGEKYLQEQLDSLANQTILPDELVVCDDGSSDRTVEILENFARTAPFPVRIFVNEKNLGIPANFCKVFSLCEKDVTFFCDQDDIWFPEKIEKMKAVFENEPDVGMVLSYDYRINQNGERIPFGCHQRYLTAHLKKENSFRTLFRQKSFIWEAHNMACRTFYRERLFKDGWVPKVFDCFTYWGIGFLAPVRIVTEPLCYFRRHGENATSYLKKIRNPIKRIGISLWNHQCIKRNATSYQYWRSISEFLKGLGCPDSPELNYCSEMSRFLENRTHILHSIRGRFPRIWREVVRGNYFKYTKKGFLTILSDIFAYPQEIPSWVEIEPNEKKH